MTGTRQRALRAAFPRTLPILAGFLFLGMTYGVYMNALGFSAWYPFCMSAGIFAGSMEFVAANLLMGAFAPLEALLLTLMINARHLFYGMSMLEQYRRVPGWKRIYMIFGMCDETFSVNCAAQIPGGVDEGWFWFFVTALDHAYWVAGAPLGGLLGSLLHLNLQGLDFVMTAMFTVIFLDQWKKEKSHAASLIGLTATLCARVVFGAGNFLLPAMGLIVLALTVFRGKLDGEAGA